jgi:bacterioferritin (cytochrome b1)
MSKELELTKLLQKALELEHAAYVQYLSHAEIITGKCAPGIIAQLKDSAKDEAKHAETLRNLIGNYLGFYPSMAIDATHEAITIDKILNQNIKDEKVAIEHYKKTLKFIEDNEDMENYCTYWEAIRQILIEEEKHVIELKVLQD